MTTTPQESVPDETTDPQETDPPRPDLPDDPDVDPTAEPDQNASSPFGEIGSRDGADFQQGTAGAEPLASEAGREDA